MAHLFKHTWAGQQVRSVGSAIDTSGAAGSDTTPSWRAFLTGVGRVPALERYGTLVGRILLAQIFLLSGTTKILNWSGTADQMASKGMPLVPLFLVGAICFELGGGLSLLLGFRARLGALALFLFLIPTTLIFHNFWAYEGLKHQEQMINFLKNIAIMGGLWMVMSCGPGSVSLDHKLSHPR